MRSFRRITWPRMMEMTHEPLGTGKLGYWADQSRVFWQGCNVSRAVFAGCRRDLLGEQEVKLQDAIDWFEGNFTCEEGAPWRWADLGMTKPYQELRFDNDVAAAKTW